MGPTEAHSRLSSLRSSLAHTPLHSCIVLHSGTQHGFIRAQEWGQTLLCFVPIDKGHLGELPSTQGPRARSPGRVRDKKKAPTQHGRIFAWHPELSVKAAAVGNTGLQAWALRGIGQHSLQGAVLSPSAHSTSGLT